MIQETNDVRQNKKPFIQTRSLGGFFFKLQLNWNIVNGGH